MNLVKYDSLDSAIRKEFLKAKERLDQGFSVTLSTCSEWEHGLHGADSFRYLALAFVIPMLEKLNFQISKEHTKGVTQYTISPKL